MATPKPPARSRNPEMEGDGPDVGALLAGVLRRMGDVLGPGAIYSLVHYGALEEGLHLKGPAPGDVAGAVQGVASLLGLKARVEAAGRDNQIKVHLKPGGGFKMDSRASVALVVGLLEGALTTARRRKVQVEGDPSLDADGTLHVALTG